MDRHNFTVMTRYISKPENLKLMMNLLRDKSPNIQFEAFHVFKVKSPALAPRNPLNSQLGYTAFYTCSYNIN